MGFRSNSSWPAPFRRLLHKCRNRLRMVTDGQIEQPAGERSVAFIQRQQPARLLADGSHVAGAPQLRHLVSDISLQLGADELVCLQNQPPHG